MISELIKRVMIECDLSQKKLADVMGVKLQRVKHLSSGWAKKLTREEAEALVKNLNIRGDWLATGEGPMIQSSGEQEFQHRLDAIKTATERVADLGLPVEKARRLQELLFALETGNTTQLEVLLQAPPAPDEAALLDNYRNSPPEGQAAIKATSAALAQQGVNKDKAA